MFQLRVILSVMMLVHLISCSTESGHQAPVAISASHQSSELEQKTRLLAPPDTGEPALHAIQNNHLQQIMRQINSLVYTELNNEINAHDERKIKAQEIARIASELASSETSILETMPFLDLNSTEKVAFVALATKLRTEALQLEELARQNKLHKIPETLDSLSNTCTSCHSLFRKSRSLLDQCKDPGYTC